MKLLQHFVHEQRAQGDEVSVLTPPTFPGIPEESMVPWSIVRRDPKTYAVALRELVRTVRERRPDVIHLHSFVAGFLGRLPRVIAGVPVVYQPHAWSFDLRGDRLSGAAMRSWERRAGNRTAMMVTNCEDEILEGRSAGVLTPARSIGVIIDTDHHRPASRSERLAHRGRCGVSQRRMLVCVGRIARQKGQDMLVAAWERKRPPDTELVLVGPGDATALSRLAPTQWGRTVRAVGEEADIRPWLHAADALVMSSRYETVSLAIAEAMGNGRPVVSTAVNGAHEVVVGGGLPPAGRVVPLGDMRALLDSAELILDDPALAERLSRAGRDRAERLFTPAQVELRLRAAYESAAALLQHDMRQHVVAAR